MKINKDEILSAFKTAAKNTVNFIAAPFREAAQHYRNGLEDVQANEISQFKNIRSTIGVFAEDASLRGILVASFAGLGYISPALPEKIIFAFKRNIELIPLAPTPLTVTTAAIGAVVGTVAIANLFPEPPPRPRGLS